MRRGSPISGERMEREHYIPPYAELIELTFGNSILEVFSVEAEFEDFEEDDDF